ncbi:acyltransferase family protein [Rhodobacteraceae bacterium HIMB11]|nr:acyltransferase family protein [Rhodobacteraceae bacterium HIMB11]
MNDTNIHPSSVIEEGAQIGAGCKIGPFCVIGPAVVLHDNVELKSHVVITGQTEIGSGSVVFLLPCWGKFRRTKNLAAKKPN